MYSIDNLLEGQTVDLHCSNCGTMFPVPLKKVFTKTPVDVSCPNCNTTIEVIPTEETTETVKNVTSASEELNKTLEDLGKLFR